jgi:hypothetical protein
VAILSAKAGGGSSAVGKARQRARNKDTAKALGVAAPRSGSSGVGQVVSRMRRRAWEDIEDEAVYGTFVVGQITDVRMLANRVMSISVQVPVEYAQEALQLGIDSATMFTAFRAYHIPRRAMMDPEPEPAAEPG